MYQIRPAEDADLPEILKIYAQARAFMRQTGNPNQWGTTKPEESQLIADILEGKLYVVTDGEALCGVFYFTLGEDPTYAKIYDGNWRSDAPYGTIHRIASRGSGVFSVALDFCRAQCSHIRIDTHQDNKVMQHVLEKHGFQRCGIIYIADGSPRIAYEMI